MVCKLASFTYGAGEPTLWRHENLNRETHEWLRDEFARRPAHASSSRSCAASEAGHLVAVGQPSRPAADFVAQPPKTEARFAFFAGALNDCFGPRASCARTPGSTGTTPGATRCTIIPDYGHLDIFMGAHAAPTSSPPSSPSSKGPDAMRPRQRIERQRGRHALVDGIPFTLPVDSRDTPALMAAFPIDAARAAELIPGNEVHPLLPRRRAGCWW